MDTIRIIIEGRPASKKNSKQVGRNRYTGKTFVTSSKAYKRFWSEAQRQLAVIPAQFTGSVRVEYVFFQKGRYSQDASNAMASIEDVLQDAGIIDDDKNIIGGTFSVVRGHPEWMTVIDIRSLKEKVGGEEDGKTSKS